MSIYTVQVMYEVRNSYRNSMYYRISLERLLEVAFFDQSHKPSFTNTQKWYRIETSSRHFARFFPPVTLNYDHRAVTYELDLERGEMNHYEKYLGQPSKVISFDRYRPTNTYTDTRIHSRPTPVQSLKHKCH